MHFQIIHDIFAPLRSVVAHEEAQKFGNVAHIVERHRRQPDVRADELPELLRRNFAESLEPGDLRFFAEFFSGAVAFDFAVAVECLLLVLLHPE